MSLVSRMLRPSADTASRKQRALALLLSSVVALPPVLLAGWTAAGPATAVSSVPGGPVILDGNDPADHVAQASDYVRSVYTNLDVNLATGYQHNSKVAVIGSCKAMLDGMAIPSQTFEEFNSAAAVAALFEGIGANNYKHLHICSDDDNTLDTAVQNELAKWGSAIASHVNRGGGLFATGHGYAWLADLFPSLVVTQGGTRSSYVTSDGANFFPTLPANSQVNAVNHYTFTGVQTTPLLPLLTEFTGGAGLRVAIGGTVVRFPQISIDGPAVSNVGTLETYTLTAATASGILLSNNTFAYTITGPTGAAGSGTATTDANGEYQFVLTGTGRGQTRIRVQLALSGGTAAGSAVTTTWLDLPAAPSAVTATDVTGEPGAVQVGWTAPSSPGGSPISDYVIQHSTDGTTWTTVTDGTSTTPSYKVTGLSDTAYRIRVAAVNADGRGPWSAVTSNRPYLPQTIGFVQPADVAATAGPLSMTVAADPSGLPVGLASNSPAVCTVSGATVTLHSAGVCSLTATQAGDGTYLPAAAVTRSFQALPPVPSPVSATTSGVGTAAQTTTVAVPPGGAVTLLGADGRPATSVTVPGEGTYTLDVSTGAITFVPVTGFSGVATGVTFRVTDAFGQVGSGTFRPTVTRAVKASVTSGAVDTTTVRTRSVPVTCGLGGAPIARCSVTLYVVVDGKRVTVGTGAAVNLSGGKSGNTVVRVVLNKKGRALTARPGGRTVHIVADITPAASSTPLRVRGTTRVVAKAFPLPRPLFFASTSSTVRPKGISYLKRLRPRLGHVAAVTCVGYTDFNGQGRVNRSLGMARAKAVCDRLTRGTDIETSLRTWGERRPQATNSNQKGRALNRRTEIHLRY